ncbi:MAG TPA: amidohydrolase family protein, partial [Nitrospiria bacterium]|nr:amidohydrolase family protein [Nitrospiria bacterium]
GVIGLETVLPLSLNLVRENVISLPQMIALLTVKPAGIIRIRKGSLEEGAYADVTLFDTETEWVVDPAKFRSKSRNSPFNGWKVKGKVKGTIVAGQLVYQDKGG